MRLEKEKKKNEKKTKKQIALELFGECVLIVALVSNL
jgi:hypothetical protein